MTQSDKIYPSPNLRVVASGSGVPFPDQVLAALKSNVAYNKKQLQPAKLVLCVFLKKKTKKRLNNFYYLIFLF